MPISHLCQNLNFTNFTQVGTCFNELVFFGDFTLFSIMILIFLGFMGVKAQLPFEVIYPSILGFSFVLWILTGSAWLMGIFLIGLLIGGILLGLMFLQNLARG